MKPFLTFDTETDPFQYRVKPEVFLAGLCDGQSTFQWWGADCINQMLAWLKSSIRQPHYIYAHNGGKFDFFYLPWPLTDPKIINGRIVEAKIGIHTLRDSFAILPFALSQYQKTEIDYDKFKSETRESHKSEIMEYHRDDLRATHELVFNFRQRFGNRLTVASTAMRELQLRHPVERKGESHDAKFRPYYYGGRVECFETGDLKGKFECFDVNSMYPHVMKKYEHPIGSQYDFCTDWKKILSSKAPGFVTHVSYSDGALPVIQDGRLIFPRGTYQFRSTTHEIRAAHKLGLLRPGEISEGYLSIHNGNFGAFVTEFAEEKRLAKKEGNKINELFAKLMLNSAYGKFGANPENYFDWNFILSEDVFPHGWELYEDWGWLLVLRKPAERREFAYFDVATAASITGAARAQLLRALHAARRPIYCDTDSIICEGFHRDAGIEFDSARLGAWKKEGAGSRCIVIGKKMYALLAGNKMIKSANKGVQMDKKDFLAVARGKDYTYFRDAPTFKRDGSAQFIQRTIKGK